MTLADRWATPAFGAAVALSLVVLFAPHAPSEHAIPHLDKVVHASLFALLAATTRWRFGSRAWLLVVLLAYGALSEVAQATLLPSRDGDVRDALADAVGALLGWWRARGLSPGR